ncbi:tail fiber domain-containing protein [Limnovirga soli]|uniref:T9SS type A sorting domain-containing protein n=1 Tax=Limnovirga soli TaxID=2656915 RepID=A0A8J8F9P3_9BACT|nr:tail fiber domain-containing protein [Limnovirga soli]NNV53983.1 T9SS type A sorting domain-containing protein [Limnovirga soli]
MKTKLLLTTAICAACIINTKAQNTFPATGNVGIGTLAPATTLQVIGTTRMGSATNYAQVDGSGILKFSGTGGYSVSGNKYAFRFNSTNYGMFFNSTLTRYELLDAAARPVFYVHADNGQGFLSGGLQISNSLQNINGNIRWTGIDFEGFDGSTWKSLSGKTSWSLNGNAGTNPSTNFIGTTDNQPLVFKINNIKAGYLSAASFNTSWGYEALLNVSETASFSSAFGVSALKNNASISNTAMGSNALENNTIGYGNTATGSYALNNNISGVWNTANGAGALSQNISGSANTAIGEEALDFNTIGQSNTAVGRQSLYTNTNGSANVAIGVSALNANTSGDANIAVGNAALLHNTTGIENVVTGYEAMWISTTGSQNTATGAYAMYDITSGSNNTALGKSAGRTNTTGFNNTYIGAQSGTTGTNFSNSTALGYFATNTASNQVRIGNSSVTSIGGYVNWSNISDGRYKKNIKNNVPGLAFINALQPVTYNLDIKGINTHLTKNNKAQKDASGKMIAQPKDDDKAIAAKETVIESGFIAQDVEKAAKKLGYNFSGVDAPKNDDDLYGLRYAEFVVPLVKAVQELSKQNEDLQKQITELKAAITEKAITANTDNSINVSPVFTAAKLQQNIPNPANSTTTILYTLPVNNGNAYINIYDVSGALIKTVKLNGTGNGSIYVQTNQLAAGTYSYTLTIDNKIIDTKKMSIIK